jgi:hypothetical protein
MFKIDVTDFEWIDGPADDPKDLCLHGKVTAQIGEEILEDDGTVSASALYLLRSLTENHRTGTLMQMIPCCGHSMIANDDLTEVYISGCFNGTDWTVEQVSGGVKITTESGKVTFIPMEEYRAEVFRFADKVEAYYASCAPKEPYDDFARKGYTAFWNEWRRRRKE